MSDQPKQTREIMTDELGNDWVLMVRSDGSLYTEPAKLDDYGTVSWTDDNGETKTVSFAPASLRDQGKSVGVE